MIVEEPRSCPDCDVPSGHAHVPGCDVERCSVCGLQWIGCGHKGHDPTLSFWTGYWPGDETARLLGFYARMVPGRPGWQPCAPGEPGAVLDINRVAVLIRKERAET